MIRINLLPYREAAKKARRQQFFTLAALVAGVGAVLVLFGYTLIEGQINSQQDKNEFLKKEVAILDKQIEEIKRLKEQTAALLARKQVIESLQRDRSDTVNLLLELTKQIPEGIYLKSVKQDGLRINLSGFAQSNARVSTLLRNIENSPWLEKPQLLEIRAVNIANRRMNEFVMDIALKRQKIEEPGKSGQGVK